MPAQVIGAVAAGLASMLALALSMRLRAIPADHVPLVHVADLGDTALVKRAAKHLGLFRLAGHGVDIDSVLNASRLFFAQSEDVKRSARSRSGGAGGFQRGYIPLAGESGLREFVELKEGFCYGKEPAQDAVNRTATAALESCDQLVSPNNWPAEETAGAGGLGGQWRGTLEGLVDDCLSITDRLHVALSLAMGREPGFLAGLAAGGEDISLMRLFHYFAPTAFPHIAPGTPRTGSSPHTDWHLVTIVVQDATGGLQVRRPRPPYDWVSVPANEGELVVILGDYLAALSEGRFVSPVHRVLLPPRLQERYSFTYFRYPRCNASIPAGAASRAEKRARTRDKRQRRHPGGGGTFNTLVPARLEGAGLNRLATSPWGDLLVDKWNGVASNKA